MDEKTVFSAQPRWVLKEALEMPLLIAALLFFLFLFLIKSATLGALIGIAAFIFLDIFMIVKSSIQRKHFQITFEHDDIRIASGIREKFDYVPYASIDALIIHQSVIDRLLGLAEVGLRFSGDDAPEEKSTIHLPGLSNKDAEIIKNNIVSQVGEKPPIAASHQDPKSLDLFSVVFIGIGILGFLNGNVSLSEYYLINAIINLWIARWGGAHRLEYSWWSFIFINPFYSSPQWGADQIEIYCYLELFVAAALYLLRIFIPAQYWL